MVHCCTLCLPVCPTDAILGSNKMMHTVMERYCTGCELCLPVCPVDCISLENITGERTGWAAWSTHDAAQAQKRYAFHSVRELPVEDASQAESPRKSNTIEAALAKAKARRNAAAPD